MRYLILFSIINFVFSQDILDRLIVPIYYQFNFSTGYDSNIFSFSPEEMNNVEMGTLTAARQFTAGPLNLPSGFLADRYRKHTPIILASAFLAFGISHFLVAQAPTFGWMTLCVVLLGVGTGRNAARRGVFRRFRH